MLAKSRNTRSMLAVVGLLLVLLVVFSSVGIAQEPLPLPPAADGSAATQAATFTLEEVRRVNIVNNAVRMRDGRIQVMVTLSSEPAVRSYVAAGGRSTQARALNAASAQRALVRAEQASFLNNIASTGARVIRQENFLVNVVTVAVSPDQLNVLAAQPGVRGIFPNVRVQRNDTTSMPLINADDAWTTDGTFAGYTGAGTVVAIIDSGIDYTHRHFGGAGNYEVAAQNRTRLNDLQIPGRGAALPLVAGAPKVIGGYDYVGDAYTAGLVAAPDPDPLDCRITEGGGHGTHVAGTAAGWGMTSAGATYAGPFDNTIFTGAPNQTAAFRIGPGVAPEAALVALKVFGCDGSTTSADVVAAMADAVTGVRAKDSSGVNRPADVINMSLGSSYGLNDPANPYNVAVTAAMDEGTIVVMSAGNSGNIFFVTGSPGAANDGMSVASSLDSGNAARAVRDDSSSIVYAASYGAGSPFIHPTLTAVSIVANPANGCAPFANAVDVAGKIVIIDRGTCGFAVKQDFAFAAGAAGVIVANNAGDGLISMVAGETPGYNLPTVFVGQTAGAALKASVNGTNTITMDWTFGAFVPELADQISDFSSRGTARGDGNTIKPDLTAPGNTILSAGSGTNQWTYNISGTSMASPHVAGMMAVLTEAKPNWDAYELKALAISTAKHNVSQSATILGPQRAGTGRVDVLAAAKSEVIAYSAVDAKGVSVAFGKPETTVSTPANLSVDITLENKGATPVEYNTAYIARTTAVGASYSVSPTTVTVPANSTVNVTVLMTYDVSSPANINTNGDPTISGTRYRLNEAAGVVEFTPTGAGEVLRVAVYAAPRAVSTMSGAAVDSSFNTVKGVAEVVLGGSDIDKTDVTSLVSAFELGAISPNAPAVADHADIAYVGVTSNYAAATEGNGQTYFGIATHGDWASLNEIAFYIYLDFDQNGTPEYIVTNGYNTTQGFDSFTVSVVDLDGRFGFGPNYFTSLGNRPNVVSPTGAETYLMNNRVVIFPMFTEYLNSLVPTDTRGAFNYYVEGYGDTEAIDMVGSASAPLVHNPSKPIFDFGMSPIYFDLDGESVEFLYDLTRVADANVPDLLLLHHHNAVGTEAQVIDFSADPVLASNRFNLLSPADRANINTLAQAQGITQITWEYPASAPTTFDFVLTRPTGTPVELTGLTASDADADGLICATGVCTLTLPTTLLDVLNVKGVYSWNVFFAGGEAEKPFTFVVNAAPIAPVLVSPANNAYVTNPAAVTMIMWTPSDNIAGMTYDFVLMKIDNKTRTAIGEVLNLTGLTPDPLDSDGLDCGGATPNCALSLDPAVTGTLSNGTYVWNVVAKLGSFSADAAATFSFSVNRNDIQFVRNPGFENAPANNPTLPRAWKGTGLTADVRVANPAAANSGNAAFRFRASSTENSQLSQVLQTTPQFKNVNGMDAGAELVVKAFGRTTAATPNVRVIMTYDYVNPSLTDGQKVLHFNAPTAGYEAKQEVLTLEGQLKGLGIKVINRTKAGVFFVDDVTVTLMGIDGPAFTPSGAANPVLPLPAAPSN